MKYNSRDSKHEITRILEELEPTGYVDDFTRSLLVSEPQCAGHLLKPDEKKNASSAARTSRNNSEV